MAHLLLCLIYLAFISLGLPDAVLGAAWPSMSQDLEAPIGAAGGIAMIIAAGTIASSLMSERLTKWLGVGKVTALSVATTALALLGFGLSTEYWMLCLFAVPYGLGAGSVDAALNNDVALHYTSRHMSWLHCMWGIGAMTGPYLMGMLLTYGHHWHTGYLTLAGIQGLLTALLLGTLPLWKRRPAVATSTVEQATAPVSLRSALKLPGAKSIMIAFFAYCALEQTVMLWCSTYVHLRLNLSVETSACVAALFFIGITGGRFANGFLTLKYSDKTLIRGGQGLILIGCLLLLFPLGVWVAFLGIACIGFGCAPIYPCIIHSTPTHFGAERSQAIIGMEMASAYVGTCLMPPAFGALAQWFSLALLPFYLLALCLLMIAMYAQLCRKH